MQLEVLRAAQAKTFSEESDKKQCKWILDRSPFVNLAFTPFYGNRSTGRDPSSDHYVFPLFENSVAEFFPDSLKVLAHPFINGDAIKELDFSGIANPAGTV